MTLVPTDGKYEELWTKVRYPIRSKTNNSDDYGEKYMKIKFNSENDLIQINVYTNL